MTVQRKYLRAAEIALLTSTSVRTVRRWINDEVLPSTKIGGARLVAAADLEAMLSPSHDTQESSDAVEECDEESEF